MALGSSRAQDRGTLVGAGRVPIPNQPGFISFQVRAQSSPPGQSLGDIRIQNDRIGEFGGWDVIYQVNAISFVFGRPPRDGEATVAAKVVRTTNPILFPLNREDRFVFTGNPPGERDEFEWEGVVTNYLMDGNINVNRERGR